MLGRVAGGVDGFDLDVADRKAITVGEQLAGDAVPLRPGVAPVFAALGGYSACVEDAVFQGLTVRAEHFTQDALVDREVD